jgi:hypothetical protein
MHRVRTTENYLAGQALLAWPDGPWVIAHRRTPPQHLGGPLVWPDPGRPMLLDRDR